MNEQSKIELIKEKAFSGNRKWRGMFNLSRLTNLSREEIALLVLENPKIFRVETSSSTQKIIISLI